MLNINKNSAECGVSPACALSQSRDRPFEPDVLAFISSEKQEPNLVQMLQSWRTIKCQSKGNSDGEIELNSSRFLQKPGLMAPALLAFEKHELNSKI